MKDSALSGQAASQAMFGVFRKTPREELSSLHAVMARMLGSSRKTLFFPDSDNNPAQLRALFTTEAEAHAVADVPPGPLPPEAEAALFDELAASC